MLESLETPCLLLDAHKMDANCERMRTRMRSKAVQMRPHVKTAKNIEVAQCALDSAEGPITVSTLREAEYFFDHGFRDFLYAVGMVPSKVARAAALVRRGARLATIVDSVAAARGLVEASRKENVSIPALIEIDSDGHRAGIAPGDPRLLDVAGALGGHLRGVMTHAGDSYNCESPEGIRAVAERERAAVVDCAREIRAAGGECPVVSVGSTPTATFAESFDGVTEVRTGVYVFHDLVMAGLGVCQVDDIAISVLASVIGHQRDKNWVITDAGWMALSRDRGTARQKVDQGYGLVCDAQGVPIGDLVVADANQEHGIIADRHGRPLDFGRFPIGSLVRILPNHACATAAQHEEYHVIRHGLLAGTWERINGW